MTFHDGTEKYSHCANRFANTDSFETKLSFYTWRCCTITASIGTKFALGIRRTKGQHIAMETRCHKPIGIYTNFVTHLDTDRYQRQVYNINEIYMLCDSPKRTYKSMYILYVLLFNALR